MITVLGDRKHTSNECAIHMQTFKDIIKCLQYKAFNWIGTFTKKWLWDNRPIFGNGQCCEKSSQFDLKYLTFDTSFLREKKQKPKKIDLWRFLIVHKQ